MGFLLLMMFAGVFGPPFVKAWREGYFDDLEE